jgi:uncharacterized membrane protein (UPF0127 family)
MVGSFRRAAPFTTVFIAFVFATSGLAAPPALKTAPLEIVTARGDYHFQVEVADTSASRERGLMFRKSLAGDRGMLFDFKTPQAVAFWMKNTLIPLDMLFIGTDGRIVSIARDARPMDETAIPSGGSVLAVLELRGGRAAEIDAEPGDRVRESIFPK